MSIMNPTDLDRARRTAQWQLWVGWATAAAVLVARLTTVLLQLSRGRLDAVDFGLAIFKSGLRRYAAGADPWRPDWVAYYFINDGASPSFVVDVSEHYQQKRDALACYASQFTPVEDGAVATRLTASTFRQLIESRDAQFGALAGVAFAEGVIVREPVQRAGLLKHLP